MARVRVIQTLKSEAFHFFLFGGILLLPAIFAWFTLRRGHTSTCRAISFTWFAFGIFVPIAGSLVKID